MAHTVLVFDSGLGGLTVLRRIAEALPVSRFVYLADNAGFPYGDWPESALTARIAGLIGQWVDQHAPDAVVVACNTASTMVLPVLRARLTIPVVGTVPAVKPAAEQTRSGVISVLATPGTVKRDYTRDLIGEFAAHIHTRLVGSARLAALAEVHLLENRVDENAIASEIADCFYSVDDRRSDTVVLACTHYPLLIDCMNRIAPWPVTWMDPAPAIARRVAQLLDTNPHRSRPSGGQSNRGIAAFTAPVDHPARLTQILAGYGLTSISA